LSASDGLIASEIAAISDTLRASIGAMGMESQVEKKQAARKLAKKKAMLPSKDFWPLIHHLSGAVVPPRAREMAPPNFTPTKGATPSPHPSAHMIKMPSCVLKKQVPTTTITRTKKVGPSNSSRKLCVRVIVRRICFR